MLSTPTSIISSKNVRTLLGSAPSNRVVLVVTRKPRFDGRANPVKRQLVSTFAAHGKIVVLFLSVHVNRKAQSTCWA